MLIGHTKIIVFFETSLQNGEDDEKICFVNLLIVNRISKITKKTLSQPLQILKKAVYLHSV